jgi:hypothetical protein
VDINFIYKYLGSNNHAIDHHLFLMVYLYKRFMSNVSKIKDKIKITNIK